MSSSFKLPFLTREREWEPHWEAKYNLLLGYPLFVCRAEAQLLKLDQFNDAVVWLGLSDEEQIALVTVNGKVPFPFPSSVYLPYLEEYALLTTHGYTPSPPVDTDMYGIIDLTDPAFGMKADFVDKDNRGSLINTSAINLGVNLAKSKKGGLLMIPAGDYYVTPGGLVNWDNIHIMGVGRNITNLYFDPTLPNAAPFLRFQRDDLGTIYNTSFTKCSLRPIPGLAEADKHRKIGIQIVNVSGFDLDIQVGGQDVWETGTSNYNTEGDSVVLWSQGKEKVRIHNPYWQTDRHINLDINPVVQEGTDPIDADLYSIIDGDFNTRVGRDRTAIKVTNKAHILRMLFEGQTLFAGGKNGFEWIDTVGGAATIDSGSIRFENVSGEQAQGTGWLINIDRRNTGKVSNLIIDNIVCDTAIGGVSLAGVSKGVVRNLKYSRYQNQATSQKALKLGAGNTSIRLDDVDIPYLSDDNVLLFDHGTMVAHPVTTDAAVGYSQVPSIVIYKAT